MFAFSVKNPASGPVYPRQGRSVSIAQTLSWATQILLSGMGEQSATGSATVTPNATTNYTLQATNGAGTTTRTCTVRVAGSLVWKSDKIYGFGQLISEDVASPDAANPGGTATTYIHSDQVGSPNWVTDASGAPAGSSKNLPFGERFVANGAQSSFRYAGHEDQPGSPVYMQARMFLPAYGRFASPDPAYDQNAEDAQSWNLYGYVRNNPVTSVDPTGETGLDVILGGIYAAADNISLGAVGWLAPKAGFDIGAQNRDFYVGATLGSIATGVQGTNVAGGGSGATLVAASTGVGIPIAVGTAGVAAYGGAVAVKSGVAAIEYASMAMARTGGKEPHGNTADDRPATRYEKYDKDGNFEKHGITKHEDPSKRYSKKEIGDGKVVPAERGSRREMLKKERELVETNPGPKNREPWAGKRKNLE